MQKLLRTVGLTLAALSVVALAAVMLVPGVLPADEPTRLATSAAAEAAAIPTSAPITLNPAPTATVTDPAAVAPVGTETTSDAKLPAAAQSIPAPAPTELPRVAELRTVDGSASADQAAAGVGDLRATDEPSLEVQADRLRANADADHEPPADADRAPTATPTAQATATPVPQPTATPEPTATPVPQPTATPEPTVTPVPQPTATPEPTVTPVPQPTATPEPTATPVPEPTAAVTTTAGWFYVDSNNGLLVRAEPGGDVLLALDHRSTVYVNGRALDQGGYRWVQIDSPTVGWVAGDFLSETEPEPPVSTLPTPSGEPPSAADWAALRDCESGGRYDVVSANGLYHGAYQFLPSTWDSVASRAGRGDLVGVLPSAASPADQDAIALALYAIQGASPWPHCGRYLL